MLTTMTLKDFAVYGSAIFLTIYGLRSIIAGIKNEKKSYWMTTRSVPVPKFIKDNNPMIVNLIGGFFAFISGILMFLFY